MSPTVSLAVLVVLLSSCAGTSPGLDPRTARPDQGLLAVAWMQQAAERDALCRQAYAAARQNLDPALADPTWTAFPPQAGRDGLAALPAAIVVDVDETVLDNVEYNARLVRDGGVYEPRTWRAWVEERAAPAVPGAVEFLRDADERGVTVFYVTNRSHELEAATRDNLHAVGLPVREDLDVMLTKGEQPDWAGSDKRTRRDAVAASHRIVMLFGDDLGDFLPDVSTARSERVAAHAEWWGQRWFVLPNPVYGSWLASARPW